MNKNMLKLETSMTSLEIAELTGKEHRNVTRDIRHMLFELEMISSEATDMKELFNALKFEHVGFSVKEHKDAKGETRYHFVLDQELTYVLVTGYSTKLRKAVIKRWMELDAELAAKKQEWVQVRKETKLEYRPMTDAIKEMYDSPEWYVYANENNLIYKLALGATCKNAKKLLGLTDGDSLRDALPAAVLDTILKLQKTNTSLIECRFSYEERKAKLKELHDRLNANLEEIAHE